ncbi:hypothetical protein ACV344_29765 [Pseudomonas aeruginosa]|uniref:hypothetical protein n=1 Tax=Pseudomonas aeruginosa TaxID=287 RepID=UPI000E6A3F0C|nr:hypothetical protein [Pseudomonas aeruginosa]MBA5106196.1 hypothetical protein [Pseudomonas aeruginosa]MBD1300224.1 hypothetical protein [Pseudomonas aeruginosa]MBD1340793.1 hypothetical protein [Pseudomonas aeruginosa]MBG4604198.1 hypothetical protein [Pseudomonas aeruginosa]MBH3592964.1 hypothetical protein [Pseudomonas aeruginosa]
MAEDNRAAALFAEAELALDTMRRDAERWRYYAGRVAFKLGITIEEMAIEIDTAIATSNRARGPDHN